MNTASKYTAALPSGEGYSLLQDDPEQVAFLVDGWEYYPGELLTPEALAGREAGQHTYSGEYPNFSHHLSSPYGTATYRLVLENRGGPRELSLYLPELLCAGRIYVNGTLAGEQGDVEPYKPHVVDGVYSFRAERATELVIQCANYSHYYSGLYYPPAVGTPTAISRMNIARMMVYGLLCFGSLAAAFSNLALWFFDRDKQNRRLGLLCLAFALRVSYPFLRSLGVPLVRPLYALEDFCAAAASLCAVTVVFPLFILPYAPLFINTYGAVLFFWKLLATAIDRKSVV